MPFYMEEEEEAWKCSIHPSNRHRNGICPVCLRDRLATLCRQCANERPCPCTALTATSSSSSSSSSVSTSFSRFSFPICRDIPTDKVGSIGRVESLIANEPAFRRSTSVRIPFFGENQNDETASDLRPKKAGASWWLFGSKTKQSGEEGRQRMMQKSRSGVLVIGSNESRSPARASKGKGWSFPSPIKALKHSKVSKMVFQEGSPMYRG